MTDQRRRAVTFAEPCRASTLVASRTGDVGTARVRCDDGCRALPTTRADLAFRTGRADDVPSVSRDATRVTTASSVETAKTVCPTLERRVNVRAAAGSRLERRDTASGAHTAPPTGHGVRSPRAALTGERDRAAAHAAARTRRVPPSPLRRAASNAPLAGS